MKPSFGADTSSAEFSELAVKGSRACLRHGLAIVVGISSNVFRGRPLHVRVQRISTSKALQSGAFNAAMTKQYNKNAVNGTKGENGRRKIRERERNVEISLRERRFLEKSIV